jgi:uncharacterized protein
MTPTEALVQFRAEKDDYYRSDKSPLDPDDVASFAGLSYFPENPALRFTPTLERDAEPQTIIVETTKNKPREQRRLGWVEFDVGGQPQKLAVYEIAEDSAYVFIPFRDATSGVTSYGGGRYLEVEIENDVVNLDFNYAFAPYCAFSDRWNCSIPPSENHLSVPIEAGEMIYA